MPIQKYCSFYCYPSLKAVHRIYSLYLHFQHQEEILNKNYFEVTASITLDKDQYYHLHNDIGVSDLSKVATETDVTT